MRGLVVTMTLAGVLWMGHAAGAQPGGGARGGKPRFVGGQLYEGAFLAGQVCRLATVQGGVTAAVFEPGPGGRAVPPMALLPCATLQRMEQVRQAREAEPRFRVSGQVMLYRGRNYLLPTAYQTVGAGDDADPAAEPAPAAEPDPSVEELVGAIEALTPEARAEGLDIGPVAQSGRLLPDGAYLRPRTGRVSPSLAGGLRFTIDNDPSDAEAGPTSLQLLPGRSLEVIEHLLASRGESARFQLSGRVFLYQGENYLLPLLVRVAHDGGSGLGLAR